MIRAALAGGLVCLLLCWLPGSTAEGLALKAAGVQAQQGTLPIRPGTR